MAKEQRHGEGVGVGRDVLYDDSISRRPSSSSWSTDEPLQALGDA